MIHFAYPAADGDIFIGCGRFRTSAKQIPDYQEATPTVANESIILSAVRKIVPELSENGCLVYEKINSDSQIFAGDSMGLAYMLALISRFRVLKVPPEYEPDIWCTGVISIIDNRHPFLESVYPNGFEGKLKGFISEENPDRLFIVPAANIKNSHAALLREHGINILTLNRSLKNNLEKVLEKKTVLKVWENDLNLLVDFLFQKPFPKRRIFLLSGFALLAMLLVSGIWYYLENKTSDAPKVPLAETITECLENGDFTRAITLVEKAPRHDAEVLKLKEMMMKPVVIEPKFQYTILNRYPSPEYPLDSPKLKQLTLSHMDFFRFQIGGNIKDIPLYLYVFQKDSLQNVQRLFPGLYPLWNSKDNPLHSSDIPFRIPPPRKDNNWMILNKTEDGEETFYFIVSPWRAKDIETLYGEIYRETGVEDRGKEIYRFIGQLKLRAHAGLPSVFYHQFFFRHGSTGKDITDE
ncbi:MAG: hypothetical protein AB7S75_02960 [Desulfococcaceae bacterium]